VTRPIACLQQASFVAQGVRPAGPAVVGLDAHTVVANLSTGELSTRGNDELTRGARGCVGCQRLLEGWFVGCLKLVTNLNGISLLAGYLPAQQGSLARQANQALVVFTEERADYGLLVH
jgi:hypothetical protein